MSLGSTIPTLTLSSTASLSQKIVANKTKLNDVITWQTNLMSNSLSIISLKDITNLIDNVSSSLSTTNTNLNNLATTITTDLSNSTSELTSSINAVASDLATTNTNLNNLANNSISADETLTASINTVSGNLTTATSNLTTLINTVASDLSNSTSELTSSINTVASDLSSTNTSLSTTNTALSTLTQWKNDFTASVQSDETLKNINDAIINTKSSILLISEQLTSITADSTYTIIEKIYDNQVYTNKVYNRSCSFIMLEGEVDEYGVLNFATGNGSYLYARFGIIIPRKSIVKSISCVSNPNGLQTASTITIPINNYRFDGTQIDTNNNTTSSPLYNFTLQKITQNNTFKTMNVVSLGLANVYSTGGNILSIGTVTTDGPELAAFTRFRLVLEIACMEDYLDESSNVVLYTPSIVPPDTTTNILPNNIDTTNLT